MKPLPTTFHKGGFDYNKVMRDGNVAIYRQTKESMPNFEAFEVGRIRTNKARECFGQHFEASESWPSSEEWGIRAWTDRDLTAAKKRAGVLIRSESANP